MYREEYKSEPEQCSEAELPAILATAFISDVAYYRRLLPAGAFSKLSFGCGFVFALRAPSGATVGAIHKGLYSWLTSDVRAAVACREKNVTIGVALFQESHGVQRAMQDRLVEAFKLHISHNNPPKDPGEIDLRSSVQCALRALRCYVSALPSLPSGCEIILDASQSSADDVGQDGFDSSDLFVERDLTDCHKRINRDMREGSPPGRMPEHAKTVLGTVVTPKLSIECIYCSPRQD